MNRPNLNDGLRACDKTSRAIEVGEAPAGQGAPTKSYSWYFEEAQRRQAGWIGGIGDRVVLSQALSRLMLLVTLSLLWPGPALADGAQCYQTSYQLEAEGQAKAALRALLQCPASQQNTYFYQVRLGWLRTLAVDYPGAVTAYKSAIAQAPRAIEPLLGLMLPQMALRLWKDAADSARSALRKDAKNFLAQSRLAWSLYNLGRFAESERVYLQVNELYPADLEMRCGLGWAQLKQGKMDAARKVFAEVLAVSPQNRAALDGMAALAAR